MCVGMAQLTLVDACINVFRGILEELREQPAEQAIGCLSLYLTTQIQVCSSAMVASEKFLN